MLIADSLQRIFIWHLISQIFSYSALKGVSGCPVFCVVCGTTPINPQLVQSIKGIIGDFLPYIIAIGSSLNINLDNVYGVSQPTEK
jgi:hypothetical protein